MSQPGGRALKRTLLSAAGVAIAFVVILLQRGGQFPGANQSPSANSAQQSSTRAPLKPDSVVTVRPNQTSAAATTPPPAPRAATTPPASTSSPTSSLRIASWNIEWLGNPEDRSGLAKNVAQSPDDLANYLAASGASIIAVEEIVTHQRGTPLRSPELEAALSALRTSTKHDWQYVIFPGRADGDQLTGVLWDASAVAALNVSNDPWDQSRDRPWALPIPKARSQQGSALWNRPPHAMKFSAGPGKTDVVIVVLHMKADYNGDFSAHRKAEAAALIRALPDVKSRFKDQDIILIGDSNCSNGPEDATRDIESAGFIDLNTADKQTHWQGGTVDRAFVPAAQPEFKAHTFEVLSDTYLKKRSLSPKDFKRRFSDHYMIVTTVNITADDD